MKKHKITDEDRKAYFGLVPAEWTRYEAGRITPRCGPTILPPSTGKPRSDDNPFRACAIKDKVVQWRAAAPVRHVPQEMLRPELIGIAIGPIMGAPPN